MFNFESRAPEATVSVSTRVEILASLDTFGIKLRSDLLTNREAAHPKGRANQSRGRDIGSSDITPGGATQRSDRCLDNSPCKPAPPCMNGSVRAPPGNSDRKAVSNGDSEHMVWASGDECIGLNKRFVRFIVPPNQTIERSIAPRQIDPYICAMHLRHARDARQIKRTRCSDSSAIAHHIRWRITDVKREIVFGKRLLTHATVP
jgi:hypothetical protein